MVKEPYKLHWKSPISFFRLSGVAWVFLGGAPLFMRMFGVHFFPSIYWIDEFGFYIRLISWTSGAAFWIAVMVINQKNPKSRWYGRSLKHFKSIFWIFDGIPTMAWLFGSALLVTTPSIITATVGTPGAAIVIVEDPNGGDLRGCSNSVKISSERIYAHGLNDRLCGIKSDFRENLNKGDRLTIFGKSSYAGLYVERIGRLKATAPPTDEMQQLLDKAFERHAKL